MVKRKPIGEIIFCYTCKTDLRIQNEKIHENSGHDVKRVPEDPRKESLEKSVDNDYKELLTS